MLKIINNKIAYTIGLLFPVFILTYKQIPVSLYLVILYVILSLLQLKKIKFKHNFIAFSLILLSFITYFISVQENWSDGWENLAQSMFLQFLVLVIFVVLEEKNIDVDDIRNIKKGLCVMCLIEIIWCYLQFVIFHLTAVNINKEIFGEIFHLIDVDKVIYLESGKLSICGFGWHPAQLVGIIVLAYCLYDSLLMKFLIGGVAAISLNSASVIAFFLCVILDASGKVNRYKRLKVSSKDISKIIAVIFLAIGVVCLFPLVTDLIEDQVFRTFERITSVLYGKSSIASTQSTFLHLRYYVSYPEVVHYSGIIKNLFGYGYDCSGYPYSVLFGQYADQSFWGVESDPINFLVGRGWIWTALFYMFLGWIAFKGKKISNKYMIFIGALVVAGVFYNNQFIWIMFLEIILYICVRRNYNFWNDEKI